MNNNNENDSLDFDFSEESSEVAQVESQSDTVEHDANENNTKNKGVRKKQKKQKSGVLIITNNFLDKVLFVPLICLVIVVLCSITMRPPKEVVTDVRQNTKCSDTRVFDEAIVMSIGEREELERVIKDYQEKLKIDIAVITINSTDESFDMREYADKYYGSKNLGWNYSGGDGLILAYHTVNNKIELVTKGRLVSLIDSSGLKKLSKAIREENNTSYFLKTMSFMQSLERSINKNAKSDFGNKALHLIPTALFFGILPTVFIFIIYRKNKSKMIVKAYIKDGSQIQYSDKRDVLVNSNTSCRVIKSSSNSSGNRSGGSSSGGGSL